MRSLFVLVLVVTSAFGGAQMASAETLAEHAEQHTESVYSGEQSVVCFTPDGRTTEWFEVGHNALGISVTTDSAGASRSVLGLGTVGDLAAQYTVSTPVAETVLGRAVETFDVYDGEAVRVRLSYDKETSALVMSEILNADGSVYCTTRMISFVVGDAGPATGVTAAATEQPSNREASDGVATRRGIDLVLPLTLAGFDRLDLAEGPQPELTSAFYGDGVFSFSLVNSPNPLSVPEVSDQPRVTIGSREYGRHFELGRAFYVWNTNQGGYVMVGEIPLDKQVEILSELPDPKSPNLFQRLWDGLFG